MKLYYRRLVAAFVVLLLSTLHYRCSVVEATRLLVSRGSAYSKPSTSSASQALKSLRVKEKNPFKKVTTSYRIVPPTGSNPRQNKTVKEIADRMGATQKAIHSELFPVTAAFTQT